VLFLNSELKIVAKFILLKSQISRSLFKNLLKRPNGHLAEPVFILSSSILFDQSLTFVEFFFPNPTNFQIYVRFLFDSLEEYVLPFSFSSLFIFET